MESNISLGTFPSVSDVVRAMQQVSGDAMLGAGCEIAQLAERRHESDAGLVCGGATRAASAEEKAEPGSAAWFGGWPRFKTPN